MDHPICGSIIVLLLVAGVISSSEGSPITHHHHHTDIELPTLTKYPSNHHSHSGNDYGPELHISSSVLQLDKPKPQIEHEIWLKDPHDHEALQYLPITDLHHDTLLAWPSDHVDESVFSKDSHSPVLQLTPFDLHEAQQIHQIPSGHIDTKLLKSYG